MTKYQIKDNKKYYFNSKKFSSLNSFYGINKEIRKIVDESQKNQENYLKKHFVSIQDKSFVSFFDMSMSANIKPNKYYGEMFNKVDALKKYAKHIGFNSPVFMTITAPSYLKPLKQINIGKNRVKLVDNPKFTGETDYVDKARFFLSEKWRKFLNQRLFKDIKKKYNDRVIYMRTYEPMIDGTPHLHLVIFLPSEFKDRFVSLAKHYFRQTRTDIKTIFDEDIGGVVAYILKYILKSFSNSKTGKLDDVGYWYAYHRIRRFTTSRTLLPLKFFRLINHKEEFQDLFDVTKLYKKGYIDYEVAINPLVYEHTDYHDVKKSQYRVSEISVFVEDFDDCYFQILYKKSDNVSVYEVPKNHKIPPKVIRHIFPNKIIPIQMQNDYFIMVNGELTKVIPTVSRMKDFQLYNYYNSLDPDDDSCNLQHFGLVQNECIQRGLIQGEIQSPNDFNLEIGA